MFYRRRYFGLVKTPTACCALAQLSMDNRTSIETIKNTLDSLKKESKEMEYFGTSTDFGGQRAVFVITNQFEEQLADKLRICGFKTTFNFERRNGYDEGNLKMWMIKI